ncbi:MAG: fasciclin domain-containing protein [Reyranella sp.]|nr:fasciclin domain-containing protein [Reyranella sp.]
MLRKTFVGIAASALLSLVSVNANAADIVDTAVKAGQFNTLAAALKAGDLIVVLKGNGPFTVFAPTDDAFKKLPPGTVENLLKPENKAQLVKILTYHVVPGKVMSSALAGKKTDAKTVQGEMVMIDATMGDVTVNGAKVVAADVAADNGVIHVIDTVLIPK